MRKFKTHHGWHRSQTEMVYQKLGILGRLEALLEHLHRHRYLLEWKQLARAATISLDSC
jgi:hypothetical protein